MKTPRQILLERHHTAGTKLDRIRTKVLSATLQAQAKQAAATTSRPEGSWAVRAGRNLWLGLIWPARGIWAGFAFVWLVIVAVNLANADHGVPMLAKRTPVSSETLMVFQQQQQRLLAEFLGASEAGEADRPKPVAPRPRSERQSNCSIG